MNRISYFFAVLNFTSVQFSSVAQSCSTLCNPMNSNTPGLPVHHQLPEYTQTHVHRVSDAIQPSHPLSSPSPAPNPSQHQSLLQWVNSSSMRWPKYWSFSFSISPSKEISVHYKCAYYRHAINVINGMVDDDGDVILLVGRLKFDWGIAWMPIW